MTELPVTVRQLIERASHQNCAYASWWHMPTCRDIVGVPRSMWCTGCLARQVKEEHGRSVKT